MVKDTTTFDMLEHGFEGVILSPLDACKYCARIFETKQKHNDLAFQV